MHFSPSELAIRTILAGHESCPALGIKVGPTEEGLPKLSIRYIQVQARILGKTRLEVLKNVKAQVQILSFTEELDEQQQSPARLTTNSR